MSLFNKSQINIQPILNDVDEVIKSGLNKGNHCGLKILNDCLCKRHYNLKNKK